MPLSWLLAVLSMLFVFSAQNAEASSVNPGVAFEEAPCSFKLPSDLASREVLCGYVSVPENHNQPEGPQIRLAVAVIQNNKRGDEAGASVPLVYLQGGPGNSGVQLAAPLAQAFPGRTVVSFDQRGIGTSQPVLACEALNKHLLISLIQGPTSSTDITPWVEEALACQKRYLA